MTNDQAGIPPISMTHMEPSAIPDPADELATAHHLAIDAAIDAGIVVDSATTAVLVDFRSGEAVHCHPSVAPMLQAGWTVRRAAPRFVDGTIKMLVVLRKRERPMT